MVSLQLKANYGEQGVTCLPIVLARPDSAAAQAYPLTARRMAIELAKRPQVATPLSVSLLGE